MQPPAKIQSIPNNETECPSVGFQFLFLGVKGQKDAAHLVSHCCVCPRHAALCEQHVEYGNTVIKDITIVTMFNGFGLAITYFLLTSLLSAWRSLTSALCGISGTVMSGIFSKCNNSISSAKCLYNFEQMQSNSSICLEACLDGKIYSKVCFFPGIIGEKNINCCPFSYLGMFLSTISSPMFLQ